MISYLKSQLKAPAVIRLRDFAARYQRASKAAVVLAVIIGVILVIWLTHSRVQAFFHRTSGYSSELMDVNQAKYLQSPAPPSVQGITATSQIGFMDKRAYVLDRYFLAGGSPLYGTGKIFVSACDKYGAPKDCTTVAAIARAETNLCRYHNSAEYHNCWGFGGGGGDRIKFGSWEESINLVTDRLVNTYGLKYMIDPSLMEKVFCGSEPGCTNWGNRVKFYMAEISDYARKVGFDHTLLELR